MAITAIVIMPNGKIEQRVYIPTNGKLIEQKINEKLEVETTIIKSVGTMTLIKIPVGEPKKKEQK